jgi:hypothetical protein
MTGPIEPSTTFVPILPDMTSTGWPGHGLRNLSGCVIPDSTGLLPLKYSFPAPEAEKLKM